MITTIIPTFRRPKSLRKAIQSVLSQTYPHCQVCIYDDASGDETKEVVSSFASDPRVKYFCHPKNIGSAPNFQFGLSRVDTPFFSFLADDDYLLPTFYEEALRGFEKFPGAFFSMGAVTDVDEKGKRIDVILSRWPDKERYSPPEGLMEMIGKYSNWTGILFRKELLEKIGLLDLKVEAIDVDFLFRAAAQVPFAVSKKPVAVFVQHPNSYSGLHGFKLIWPGWPMMMEKMKTLSPGDQVQQLLRLDFIKHLTMNCVRSIAGKKFDEAKQILSLLQEHGGSRPRILLLSNSITLCQALPLVHRLFTGLLHLRRKIKRGILKK